MIMIKTQTIHDRQKRALLSKEEYYRDVQSMIKNG